MQYFLNNPPQPASLNILGPQIFTNFANTNFWIPVYPDPLIASLTFNGLGAMTLATVGSAALTKGYYGVRSRFRLFPDANGLLTYRFKYGPISLARAPVAQMWGGFITNTMGNATSGGPAIVIRSAAANNLITIAGTSGASDTITNGANVPCANATDPAQNLDMIGYFGRDTATGSYRMLSFDYSIDNGGESGIGIATAGSFNFGPDLGVSLGFNFFLGAHLTSGSIAESGTLTYFEIIKGIGVLS